LKSNSKIVAFIPARSGSQRVVGKNIRPLHGHPMLAYSISSAIESGIFSRIIVSTDSEEYAQIARHYGAEVPGLRPVEMAATTSPDIEWVAHSLAQLGPEIDAFAILRPTSPFRSAETIKRAWRQLQELKGIDSVRAVELVKQHPGKMWKVADDMRSMKPLLEQSDLPVPLHSQQYQALPKVYVQNSSLEVAWVGAVSRTNTISGHAIAPFFTEGAEGMTIDYEGDWDVAEKILRDGSAKLPSIAQPPFVSG
jgi:CMP-N,N'-diacetyllegionaminic acid synthase